MNLCMEKDLSRTLKKKKSLNEKRDGRRIAATHEGVAEIKAFLKPEHRPPWNISKTPRFILGNDVTRIICLSLVSP